MAYQNEKAGLALPGNKKDCLQGIISEDQIQAIAKTDPNLAAVLEEHEDPEERARILAAGILNNPAVAELMADKDPGNLECTETANARRFVEWFGEDFRYVAEAEKWFYFDGKSWGRDIENRALKMTASLAERLRAIALAMPANTDNQRAIQERVLRWGSNSFSKRVRQNALTLAAVEDGIPARLGEFDSANWLLNCQNGTLDLRTGELRPHNRDDLLTHILEIEFSPAATCPRWNQFLGEIFEDNTELIEFIRRAVGYSLTGSIREQVIFILHGCGANGKSVFLDTLRQILGLIARHSSIETFSTRAKGQIPEDRARLAGARFVTVSESKRGQVLDEAFIKDTTGGEPITARFMQENSFEFHPTFKLWLASNHKPTITGTDEGIWRRVRLIPFTRTFAPAERDKTLPATLQGEAAGILAWAVQGCLAWQSDGLNPPEIIEAASAEYRSESDTLGLFIEECCEVSEHCTLSATDLYSRYDEWAKAGGFCAMNSKNLGQAMVERGFTRARTGTKGRFYRGLTLNE